MASTRELLSRDEFVARLTADAIPAGVALFVWEATKPYYFSPLTPLPADRLITDFKVDPEDLADMMSDFEKRISRVRSGQWEGADDPSLTELAKGLLASTVPA